ncbi:HNH/ENDO VII family nuclease [Belliella sp. DSM 107340]|uniref:HNH/ENDO VII family nuclease n=1 Tax=Belliella calami TaxID=2923436 RepID=A0ABS9URE0_9BACT|nr:HNH/ENDO VII family nuclease [Belliella calami]MCH7399201.1 HNH/ENDO VII family nuclease [Belliella calami]
MRTEIDKVFNLVKAAMHREALKRGNGWALYKDCYTGQTMIGGDPYDYEHIYGSEWVHSTYKHLLTDEQIAKVVNCPENVAVTLRSINQSKGKTNPEIWFAISGNLQKHGIDGKLAMENIKNAKAAIEKNVRLLVKG